MDLVCDDGQCYEKSAVKKNYLRRGDPASHPRWGDPDVAGLQGESGNGESGSQSSLGDPV